jgi:hypothetical protein
VQPGAVVPGDVLHDRAPGVDPGRPGAGVDQLALERGEERLRQGVVPALARPADRQCVLALLREGGVGGGGLLAAAVGVEDHARLGIAGRDRVGQGAGDQLGAQVIGQGERDDAAGGDVDHSREVEPSLPGRDVSDVAAPAGVELGGVGGEVPADPVRGSRRAPPGHERRPARGFPARRRARLPDRHPVRRSRPGLGTALLHSPGRGRSRAQGRPGAAEPRHPPPRERRLPKLWRDLPAG